MFPGRPEHCTGSDEGDVIVISSINVVTEDQDSAYSRLQLRALDKSKGKRREDSCYLEYQNTA